MSAALAFMLGPTPCRGQTTPKVTFVFPAGAQRGTKVDVQIGGDYLPGPCQLNVAGDGLTAEPVGDPYRYRFSVADDAPPERRELRLCSVQGASPPFPFVVGDLPEIVCQERSAPQELPSLPVTVNGRLDAEGDVDEFAVILKAGTQIVCAATTQAIRSPVDPLLRLLDADGKTVAESFPHRTADGLLVFRATQTGRYTLQLFDFQMNGGAEFTYRLTVTAGPWLDFSYPAGVARKAESTLTVRGWNLPGEQDTTCVVRVPPQTTNTYTLTLPGAANRLQLPVGEDAELLENEPNDRVDQAANLPFPVTMNGRLQTPGDVDLFAFTAKKKDKFSFDVESIGLDFPCDGVLSVVDETGKTVVELDDSKTSRDPSLRFIAPADGRYFVSMRDRSRRGGEDYVYRLHFTALQPRVTARVNTTSLLVPNQQTVTLPVLVERIDGHVEELEIAAEGLPAGVEAKPQPIPAKTPATVQLPITAGSIGPWGGLVRIVVRGKSPDLTLPPSETLWLAVGPEVPFTLKVSTTILDAPRLAAFPFPVRVERKAGFTGAIRLVGVEPDRRGTLLPLEGQIAADSDLGSIPLVLQNKVTEGTTHRCRVMGVADVPAADGKTYPVFHIAPGNMSLGCQPSLITLSASPSIIVRRANLTQDVEVHLARRAAMQPITVRLVVPDDVTGIACEPVEVPAGEDTAKLTLRFGPDFAGPPRTKIEIKAESSRSGLPIYGVTELRLESP